MYLYVLSYLFGLYMLYIIKVTMYLSSILSKDWIRPVDLVCLYSKL